MPIISKWKDLQVAVMDFLQNSLSPTKYTDSDGVSTIGNIHGNFLSLRCWEPSSDLPSIESNSFLQQNFQFWKCVEVGRSYIRGIKWLMKYRYFEFGKKFHDREGHISWSVVVVDETFFFCLTRVHAFSFFIFSQKRWKIIL